jgi:hypothetical protein
VTYLLNTVFGIYELLLPIQIRVKLLGLLHCYSTVLDWRDYRMYLAEWYLQQCCESGSGRIRTFLVGSGSGSGRLGPDPGLNKWLCINFFGVCKSHKYLRNLCFKTFWSMKILFRAYFHQKKFSEKSWPKIYQCPDVFKSRIRIRIRIRSKIVRIRNTDLQETEKLAIGKIFRH